MSNRSWSTGFHLHSPRAWINDPNGCCEFRGVYRLYYQYNSYWPSRDQKGWGAFSSANLVDWSFDGVPLEPSVPQDRDGVYTGSSLVQPGAAPDGGDLLRVFYTGNRIDPAPDHDPRDVDYVLEGRQASQLTAESADGVHFSPKRVVLSHTDYPDFCSTHVRDPKVWEEDGHLYMLLGARDLKNRGLVLLYTSDDGYAWEFDHALSPEQTFGYMWECPNIVRLDGHEYLAVSPQGLPRQYDRWHNLWQAGYFPLPSGLLETRMVDERTFVEWDHGHDFYAPQIFIDEQGRHVLVGWMGTFDASYDAAPDGLSWCHCLTVPRLLTRDAVSGRILQIPVPELERLRRTHMSLAPGKSLRVPGRLADIEVWGISCASGSLVLDDSLQVSFAGGALSVRYLSPRHAAGRQDRSIPLDGLHELRVLVDGSAVEIYANGGAEVFSCRWFPEERESLDVRSSFVASESRVFVMEDRMASMYATAKAPDLTLKGRPSHS